MKVLFSFLFSLFLTFAFVSGSLAAEQSDFLKEFQSGVDISKLLHASGKNIDGFEIFGGAESDRYLENAGTFVRNRSFEVGIYNINASENLNILKEVRTNLEKSLEKHKLKYKELTSFPEGFDLQYSSNCVVGFVSVRGVYKEGGVYFMSFIFNESVCSKKNARKK